MGAVSLPEMRRRGYSPSLAAGCVAAGGTLGQLVPPSTIIVLYCFLTEVSIGRMFIERVRQEVRARAFPIPAERTTIRYASLGGDAGYAGAAGLARLEHRRRSGITFA